MGDASRCVLCAVRREACAGVGHPAFPVVESQLARNTTTESWSFSPPLPILPSRGPTICNPWFQHRKDILWLACVIHVRAAPVSPPSTAYTWDLGTPLHLLLELMCFPRAPPPLSTGLCQHLHVRQSKTGILIVRHELSFFLLVLDRNKLVGRGLPSAHYQNFWCHFFWGTWSRWRFLTKGSREGGGCATGARS